MYRTHALVPPVMMHLTYSSGNNALHAISRYYNTLHGIRERPTRSKCASAHQHDHVVTPLLRHVNMVRKVGGSRGFMKAARRAPQKQMRGPRLQSL
jgi:hypothetical protein